MAKVTMAMNVPLEIEQAKYLDWMPPNQFGSQLRLKGTIGGDKEAVLYIPGKCWAAGKALINAGVIGEMDFDTDPAEAQNIPLLKTAFILTNKQVVGKNYGNIAVSFQGAPQSALQKAAIYEAGPGLPGEEEGYLDTVLGQEVGIVTYTGVSKSHSIPADPMESVGKLYLECMKFVIDRIVPIWSAGDIPYDASALNAAAATLMIQRGKR